MAVDCSPHHAGATRTGRTQLSRGLRLRPGSGSRRPASDWSTEASSSDALAGFLVPVLVLFAVTLTWHWFADLWAGLMVGGAVLALTSAVDHTVPQDVYRAPPA